MTREEAIKTIYEALETLIPELSSESEDERTRKEIIDFIQWAEDRGMTRHDYHQAKRPAVWIAYLEKQKKQDKCPEYRVRSHCVGCQIYEKQKEQKPVEWTELTWKDIVELEGIINNVHYDFSAGIGQESFGKEVLERFRLTKGIEYLDEAEQKYWQKEQKPAEWGEEDKNKLHQVMEILLADKTIALRENPHCKALHRAYDELLDWFKSLPERFSLQPKQEWGDGDLQDRNWVLGRI